MRIYVQSYIVQAEPCLDANGRNGYDVYYPDGRTNWMPAGDFDLHHRPLDVRERMILDMTAAEQLVMAISDKDHSDDPHYRPDVGTDQATCSHIWAQDGERGRRYCELCGADGDG